MQAVYWLLCGECSLYIGSCVAHVWRMQAVYWLLSGLILGNVVFLSLEFLIKPMGVEVLNGSCLENAGCILASVWRLQNVCWLMSGVCGLYNGSCVENTGRILTPVWRMQAVAWFLCEVCPGSNFLSGPKQVASHVCNFGHTNQTNTIMTKTQINTTV